MNDQLFSAYRVYLARNMHLEPTFRTLPVSSSPTYQWVGGILADEVLYGTVNGATSMLALSLSDGKASLLDDFGDMPFKWSGECRIGDALYMFPRAANALLRFDLRNKSFKAFPTPCAYPGEHHYGGVLADGRIWQPPRGTDHLLIWDADGACTALRIADHPVRYCGSVRCPDGNVYFLPENGEPILRLDVKSMHIEAVTPPVSTMVFDAKVSADGCIYGYSGSSGLMRLDPFTGDFAMLFREIAFRAYGTKTGANGRMYSLPGWNGTMWEFTPDTGALREVYTCAGAAKVHFAGGAVDPHGNIYAIPVFENHVLAVEFGAGESIPPEVYAAFFEDCY
jgi:hypothetical protein